MCECTCVSVFLYTLTVQRSLLKMPTLQFQLGTLTAFVCLVFANPELVTSLSVAEL